MQKHLKIILPTLTTILLMCLGCHKFSSVAVSPAAINIVNAIPNSTSLIPVFDTAGPIDYFAGALSIGYLGAAEYSPLSGPNTLYIVQSTDTVVTVHGGARLLFNGTLNLLAGGTYSFFLTGDTTNVDTLFIQEHIPVYSDSSAGVRFVNLSTGSLPMSVTIEGNRSTQTEFSNLAYKCVSGWNKYPAGSGLPGYYSFTVRDLATGDSLTTFIWNYTLFRNNTLIISGSEAVGSATPIQISQMNNF